MSASYVRVASSPHSDDHDSSPKSRPLPRHAAGAFPRDREQLIVLLLACAFTALVVSMLHCYPSMKNVLPCAAGGNGNNICDCKCPTQLMETRSLSDAAGALTAAQTASIVVPAPAPTHAAAVPPPSPSPPTCPPRPEFGQYAVGSPMRRVVNLRRLMNHECGNALTTLAKDTPPGAFIIDIGAHGGEEAMGWAEQGFNVLTFEATPSKVTRLQGIIDRSGLTNIKLVHAAVSNYTGTALFNVMDGPGGSQQDAMAVPWKEGVKMEVPVVKLDDYVQPGQRVAFIKSDTQGHELQVLQGARRLLANRQVDMLHLEYSPTLMDTNIGRAGAAPEMLDFLFDYGYQCVDCGEESGPPENRPSEFRAFTSKFVKFQQRGAEHGGWTDVICF